MNDWIIHFGAYTDFTYDLTTDDKEVDPIPSSIPESILNLAQSVFEYNENQEKNLLQKEKSFIEQDNKFRNPTSRLSTKNLSSQQYDDVDFSDDSSSSSADFEIETLQKTKNTRNTSNVKMNRVIYSFAKPEPEVRRFFVTSKAPRSSNNEKKTFKKEYVHLKTRLTTRRKIPVSSMVHQHELMLCSISDLENKK